MKQNGRKWIGIAAGVVLAVISQLAVAWYAAGRGYGSGQQGYALNPAYIQDYDISDGRWTVTGEVPMILFQTDQDIGRIHISLKEPLEQDTIVLFYFVKNPDDQFDRFCRTERYMMKGTREADLTVLPGAWRSFRLEIRGDFVPEEIMVIPAPESSSLSVGQVLDQLNVIRTIVLCCLFSAGMYLWSGCRKTSGNSSPQGKKRMVWLDMVRNLAAVLVITVHVVEPITLILRPGSKLLLLAKAISIGALTCNLLFVLISGALLLPYREESVGAFVGKRLMSVVMPLMVYAVFYIRLACISQVPAGTWIEYYLRTLISGSIIEAPHLWLVYELIGLYLAVIPFRYLLKNLPERLEKALTLLILVLLGLRTASGYFYQPVGIDTFLGDWPGIFLLGYLLTRNWMRRYDRLLIAGGAAAFALSLWLAGFRADYKALVCNQSILMALMSMAVFVVVLRMDRWLQPFERILSVCSGYSYSVLLIHWYVLNHFIYSGWMSSQMSGTVQVILPVFACLIVSLAVSFVTDHLVTNALSHALSRGLLRKM